MARFDVYESSGGLFVDVQADTLDVLDTRVIIPLMTLEVAPKPARRLNPKIVIRGQDYYLQPQYISAVTPYELGRRCGDLKDERDRIVAALHVLFQGV